VILLYEVTNKAVIFLDILTSLLGCDSPLGMGDGTIPDSHIKATTQVSIVKMAAIKTPQQ